MYQYLVRCQNLVKLFNYVAIVFEWKKNVISMESCFKERFACTFSNDNV